MIRDLYKELLTKVNEGNECVMVTYLDMQNSQKGSITKKLILTREDIEKKSFALTDEVYEKICLSLENGKIVMAELAEKKSVLVEPFMPKPRLIIFGAGHVSKPVAEFASRVGFSVTVIDDRTFFANQTRFPEADRIICEDFEKSFDLIDFKKSDFVTVITRGHRYDGVVLREVLKHDLSYIGMIGSKRRVKAMMEELIAEGFSKEKLDSVNSPIGLDIGAVIPDEIAISIIAQLISYKNKGAQNKYGKDFILPEFDAEVVETISQESIIPRSLITILSSKGSVPRKAGAKMVAYLDGSTIGSIGGGCSEAAVITKARNLMLDKGFFIEHVDMTGDVAESEGMVCGGVMEVLVEVF
jgi:xanthine dehydrogenase accessory factor